MVDYNGQNFPTITAQYIHKVATKLYNYNGKLPPDFEISLVDFVKKTKSHVATLNYDKLLYNSFIENDVFGPYQNTSLVDGMIDAGFSSGAMERQYGNNYGYYLHLHGSPLFVNKDENVQKLSRNELTLETSEASEHIVLTHVEHKPSVIAASHVLSTYWDYLRFALSEVKEVILFGYSGLDTHLNNLLRPYCVLKQLRVVEWSGAGDAATRDRDNYWKGKLALENVKVIRLDNITDFTDFNCAT